ncbi:MAG: hypothetical protein ACR2P8_10390 [Myxococcota bacterium]
MAGSEFQTFLAASMLLLEQEKPSVYARIGAMLRDEAVNVTLDGAALGIRFPHGRFAVGPPVEHPLIELASDRRAILDVVDGVLTLEDAVWDERIRLFGSLAALLLFLDALVAYLQGAVRCPSFPWLLDRYRDRIVPTRHELERRLTGAPGPDAHQRDGADHATG